MNYVEQKSFEDFKRWLSIVEKGTGDTVFGWTYYPNVLGYSFRIGPNKGPIWQYLVQKLMGRCMYGDSTPSGRAIE